MKKLLLFCLLATACTSSPTLTASQLAVVAYLKKSLDDPSSYQPLRWGKPVPYLRTQAEREEFGQLMATYKIQQDSVVDYIRGEASEAEVARLKATADAIMQRAEPLGKRIDNAEAAKDSASIGVVVPHTFRAKNKMGALVLDSARFIVPHTGAVTAMR
jgi:hypothetical protein